ncbi:MAG: nuclear transport factor 2 family protein [Paludibacteraceae bacterium]|nr:nuclear transport factor 2 family protein [Paludibacteraceae bacterium]
MDASELLTLQERITRLEDIEAVRALQARYQRSIDHHDWTAVGDCFAEDAVSAYDGGKMSFNGRDAIVDFLRHALTRSIKSSHLIHGGEIDVDGDKATGIWYLEDFLLHKLFFVKLHGTAVYHVDYCKVNGQWKIKKIGYVRNYHYFQLRSIVNLFTLR